MRHSLLAALFTAGDASGIRLPLYEPERYLPELFAFIQILPLLRHCVNTAGRSRISISRALRVAGCLDDRRAFRAGARQAAQEKDLSWFVRGERLDSQPDKHLGRGCTEC